MWSLNSIIEVHISNSEGYEPTRKSSKDVSGNKCKGDKNSFELTAYMCRQKNILSCVVDKPPS